jgi:predicted PurR-regulated permease PerM
MANQSDGPANESQPVRSVEETVLPNRRRRSTPSQRLLAAGVIIAFSIWASSVVMTLLFAVLTAYFLDPPVTWLERVRVPRALGAVVVLLLGFAVIGGLGYLMYDRVENFASDWPRYATVLRGFAGNIEKRIARIETRVQEITPTEPRNPRTQTVSVEQQRPVRSLLFQGLGSLYGTLLFISFVPFLIYFMLARKKQILQLTLELFPPPQRDRAGDALDEMSRMLRGYVAGNVLVAIILVLVSWAFFSLMGLDYPFMAGLVSGLLNLIPYLGLVLSWLPPFVIGMGQWNDLGPYVAIAATLTVLHIITLNLLIPAIIGRRVHLNALAVTMALLFWGWAWGAMGLILAIPIVATAKVIFDHIDGMQPVGRWLGSA